ncbi:unnamed protein product [Pseudo-nitzschia multistriata]|uniref:Uncharacterized protein n=1 Tax=Pseudo-nitzschia multistriata TaxID=183589 RepID=A0A448ZQG7_9STRA|nr:unnamed protein product [Pseudo-nitzschia multistriata]
MLSKKHFYSIYHQKQASMEVQCMHGTNEAAIRSGTKQPSDVKLWVTRVSILVLSILSSPSHFAQSFAISKSLVPPSRCLSGHERVSFSFQTKAFHEIVQTHSLALFSTSNAPYIRELDGVDDLQEGSLVLSRVESSLGCHDLRQPYFHKAVILILDHDPNDFTQGVLLNRASDLTLDDRDIVCMDGDCDSDDDGDGNDALKEDPVSAFSSTWRIHFGGDIGGWYEEVPQLLCVHMISSEAALAVSDPIFHFEDGIFITSFPGARSLVESGEATSDDFYTFSGFCGWERDQLQREVDRGSWCLASFTNTKETILVESESSSRRNESDDSRHKLADLIEKYSWKNSEYKPQSGGLEFWHELMHNLGKDNVKPLLPYTAREDGSDHPQPFSDLMVKEWSTQRLIVTKKMKSNGYDDGGIYSGLNDNNCEEPVSQIDDADIFRVLKAAATPTPVMQGSILRGSSSPSSPYVTSSQLFYKSTILLLQDTPEASVGVMLNLPTKDAYVLRLEDKDYHFTVRYGGPSGKGGEEDPYFWFHDCDVLKEEGIGLPVSFSNAHPERSDPHGIHVCDIEDVREAVQRKLVQADEFLLVQGFCLWEKEAESAGGVTGQLLNGNLEDTQLQTTKQRESLWRSLLDQKQTISEDRLQKNFELSQQAWKNSGGESVNNLSEDIRYVFDSNVEVSKLADDALFTWMKIFLLGNAFYLAED